MTSAGLKLSPEGDIDLEDLIEDEEVVITLTRDGYIKRLPLDTYRSQGRRCRHQGTLDPETDLIENLFNLTGINFFFCSRGKVFR